MRSSIDNRYQDSRQYMTPHEELLDYYDARGDYFSSRKSARRPERRRVKKHHGVRNFCLLLLFLGVLLWAAARYGIGGLGQELFGSRGDTSNIRTDYLIDMDEIDTALSSVSTGYYPSEEELYYLSLVRERNPELSEKLDLFSRHIDAFSRNAVLTLYLSPEKLDYVLQDPVNAGSGSGSFELDVKKGSVPLLVQYDKRWGNHLYGSGGMGNTGCGPTCLSMVAAGLTGDGSITPDVVADFALQNGYYIDGTGTAWSLFTSGAEHFGLRGSELPVSEEGIKAVLSDGGAVILSVSQGDFTFSGHFIVVTDYSGGRFTVCDPSSIERSRQSWEPDKLLSQTAAAWGLTA